MTKCRRSLRWTNHFDRNLMNVRTLTVKLKGEIERQKQLAEQQEGALIEKHRSEAEAYEAEQKELNNALIHK
jgi:hypothetical protein